MKFLYQPVKPFRVFQFFGDDMACISNADNKTLLVKKNHDTCPAGFRSLYSMMNGHNGLDVGTYRWQPVYCAQGGRVDEISTEVERGLGVGVRTQIEDRYFRHRYWHLIAIDVDNGEELSTGDLIGYADSTGFSSGDHLHFELKEVDQNGRVLNSDNGYFGAIDPLPFMEDIFALDIKGINASIKLIREKIALLFDLLADKFRKK